MNYISFFYKYEKHIILLEFASIEVENNCKNKWNALTFVLLRMMFILIDQFM